jgi:hypothetical protein
VTAEGRRVMVRVLVPLLVVLTGCSAQPHEPRVSPSPSDRSQEIGAAIDAYVAERQYGATRAVLVSHRVDWSRSVTTAAMWMIMRKCTRSPRA